MELYLAFFLTKWKTSGSR